MDWALVLAIILGSFCILLALGLPVAFSFMLINVVGMYLFFGGELGLKQLVVSMASSVTTFTLLPLPLFVLMGEIIFNSGISPNMIEAIDKIIGRIPGRLSLIAIAAGVLLATLTGTSVASVLMLGHTLYPEMIKRNYKKPMIIGPLLGSGGLAILIPPSGLAVLVGAIGQISIGGILIGIIVPGLVVALNYVVYVVVRCKLQPDLAPIYAPKQSPMLDKVIDFAKYVLPIGIVIFSVIGVILLGIASPSESAATGALGCFCLALAYRKLNWATLKKTMASTIRVSVMILMIMVGATAFGQIISISGAGQGFVQAVLGLKVPPLAVIILMQVIVVIMGCFMEQSSIAMITLPLFMPIVHKLGFEPIWFGVLILLNLEIATISPPFGLCLFAMKGVVPADVSMGDIYYAAYPFFAMNLFVMALLIVFPQIVMWLPSFLMRT